MDCMDAKNELLGSKFNHSKIGLAMKQLDFDFMPSSTLGFKKFIVSIKVRKFEAFSRVFSYEKWTKNFVLPKLRGSQKRILKSNHTDKYVAYFLPIIDVLCSYTFANHEPSNKQNKLISQISEKSSQKHVNSIVIFFKEGNKFTLTFSRSLLKANMMHYHKSCS